MSTFQKKTVYKKSPYGNAKHFTNTELMNIINKYNEGDKAKSWMSFDVKNETKNEKMVENKVRYLQILITDADGKDRPLIRDTAGTTTKSKCKLSKSENGKIPSSATFSTRILIMTSLGDEVKVEDAIIALKIEADEWSEKSTELELKIKSNRFIANQKYIDELMASMADAVVQEKFPTISEDQFTITAKRQEELIKQQYLQWQVEKHLGSEFERLLNDEDMRDSLNWTKKNDQTIGSNVARSRNPREGDADDKKLAKANGGIIPLAEWMVYYRLRIDTKDGSLWCKILDVTTPQPKSAPKKMATLKNPETGRVEFLNYNTVESWMRYGSAYTGICKYQLCISGKGARMHAAMSEIAARRGAKSEGMSQIDDEAVDGLADFGGPFGGNDDEDDEEEVKPKKKSGITAIEQQMADLEAGAASD